MAVRRPHSPETEFYRRYAAKLIQDAKVAQEQPFAYQDLAERLPDYGVDIEHQALINRINRGAFSFTFALQVLAALGVKSIPVPQPPRSLKRTSTRR